VYRFGYSLDLTRQIVYHYAMLDRPICQKCGKNKAKQKGMRSGRMRYGALCSGCYKRRVRIEGAIPPKYSAEERAALHARNYRKAPYRRYLGGICSRCGFVPELLCQLVIHHIDHNHRNNDPVNLQTLCHNCHHLFHHLDRLKAKQALS